MAHKIKEKNQNQFLINKLEGFSNGLVRVCDWFYFTFGIPGVRESVGTQVVSMRGCILMHDIDISYRK